MKRVKFRCPKTNNLLQLDGVTEFILEEIEEPDPMEKVEEWIKCRLCPCQDKMYDFVPDMARKLIEAGLNHERLK